MQEVRDIGRQASGRQQTCHAHQIRGRCGARSWLGGAVTRGARGSGHMSGRGTRGGSLGTHVSVMNVRRPSRSQYRLWRCDDSDGGHSGSRISVALRAGRTAQYFRLTCKGKRTVKTARDQATMPRGDRISVPHQLSKNWDVGLNSRSGLINLNLPGSSRCRFPRSSKSKKSDLRACAPMPHMCSCLTSPPTADKPIKYLCGLGLSH